MTSSILVILFVWILLCGLFTQVAGCLARKWQLTPGFWVWVLLVPSIILLPIPNVLIHKLEFVSTAHYTALEPVAWMAGHIAGPVQTSSTLPWAQLALTLIMLVSLLRLGRLLQQYRSVCRLARQSVYYPQALRKKVIPRNVQCRLLPAEAPPVSAFVAGLYRPVIVLPRDVLQLSQQQQQIIIEHELNHIRFGDHWWLMGWHCLCAVAWFNPFLSRLSAHFTHAVEMRCDGATIRQGGFSHHAYAQALIASLKQSAGAAPSSHDALMQLSFTGHGIDLAGYKQRVRVALGTGPAILSWQRHLPVFVLILACLALAKSTYTWALASAPGNWIMPVAEPVVSSVFGHVATFRHNRVHQGVDFKGPVGTAVQASAAGQVMIADDISLNPSYGKVVLVRHGDGWQTLYAHLDSIDVQAGEQIKQGQAVGTMGATGKVTGPHLHFELLENGHRHDPMAYLIDAQNAQEQ
ncbi:M23/M56 family metallopeptidase [Lacimicrobium alkaliphilum]|uniref:Peptidase M23 domain-containing protein n=1 Tax=Lacimicrobium alkaliphilum TaxID=1526571 RepID=A0ABQ1R6D5_9ALTE|nr:M23/M56 family metallopeptidase [Lacimicrobium alkaliphilum]GGD59834.1 hypothetical protein GCM10011357_13880 [Lacimicrobium alkaliphilum]